MKIRPFELALITFFAILALVALMMLSMYKPTSQVKQAALGNSVVIWGTVPATAFDAVLKPLVDTDPAYRVVQYVQKDARTFDDEVVNALAESRGPDIVFLPSEKLVQYRPRLQPLSESTFPLRDFRNLYIDGAEIFALSDGVYAYPVAVDPLVMYYNRDLLATKNIINAPSTWEELVHEIKMFTISDYSHTISRATLAFGEYANVTHSFEVLSMLLLQNGSAMVTEGSEKYKVLLNQSLSGVGMPLQMVLNFYTGFNKVSTPEYTWNRAMPDDRSAFVGEKLVFYFGKGSEAAGIEAQNPNLNFDVAEVPNGKTATVRRTYGTFYGMALLRNSSNKTGALTMMQILGSAEKSRVISDSLHMAPAQRTTLTAGSNDKYGRIYYDAAKVARGWLAPAPDTAGAAFQTAIDDINSIRRSPSEAANDTVKRLSEEY